MPSAASEIAIQDAVNEWSDFQSNAIDDLDRTCITVELVNTIASAVTGVDVAEIASFVDGDDEYTAAVEVGYRVIATLIDQGLMPTIDAWETWETTDGGYGGVRAKQ